MFAAPPSFSQPRLGLSQPCHFLGILKSNSITIESSCEMDWFAEWRLFVCYAFTPSLLTTGGSSRRDICHQSKRDCAIMPANGPWIERGVYRSRAAVYTVAYLHPKVPRRTRVLPLQADSEFWGAKILEQPRDTCPDLRDYLKDSTLWKVSRSTVDQFPH